MNKGKLKSLFKIWDILKAKGSWTELAGISKPFIYILSIVKYGNKSIFPLLIAFLFHIASLMTSMHSYKGGVNKIVGKYFKE